MFLTARFLTSTNLNWCFRRFSICLHLLPHRRHLLTFYQNPHCAHNTCQLVYSGSRNHLHLSPFLGESLDNSLLEFAYSANNSYLNGPYSSLTSYLPGFSGFHFSDSMQYMLRQVIKLRMLIQPFLLIICILIMCRNDMNLFLLY